MTFQNGFGVFILALQGILDNLSDDEQVDIYQNRLPKPRVEADIDHN